MQAKSGQVLLAGTTVVIADLQRGTARTVANLPELLQRSGTWTVALADDGALLMGTKVQGKLQLKRTSDLGVTWSDVGEPMEPGEELGAGTWLFPVVRGGSVLMLNLSAGFGRFVNGMQFVTEKSAQHVGTTGHFLTPAFLRSSVDVSPDGQRAATWENDDLVLIDASGEKRVLLTSSEPGEVHFIDP